MPEMNSKMKIALALVPVILMAGCGDKPRVDKPKPRLSADEGTNQPTPAADESKTRLADPSPPITGAFGWTLGQKMPESIQLNFMEGTDLAVYSYKTSTNPPFETIVVGSIKDRTIYMIAGCTTNTGSLQYDVLVDALNLKYGVAEDTRPNDVPTRTWLRPAAGHEVQIRNNSSEGISLSYVDLNVFKSLSDKL
jgi:hypothetical protein